MRRVSGWKNLSNPSLTIWKLCILVHNTIVHNARVTYKLRLLVGRYLIENMVTPLCSQLKCYSGFFQQVCEGNLDELKQKQLNSTSCLVLKLTSFDVSRGKFSWGTKVDSYEFALDNKKDDKNLVNKVTNHWYLWVQAESLSSDSQSVRSYHFWQFWHFQRLPAVG